MTLSVRVWDFVNRNFKTIAPDATLGEAMEVMDELIKSGSNSMTLVVVNKKFHPIGVISMRNILDGFKGEFSVWHSLLGKEGWQDAMQKGLKQCNYRMVEDYMVRVPHLSMNDSLLTAYKMLTEKSLQVRAIPVVEADKLEGIVRIPDLFQAFVEAYRREK